MHLESVAFCRNKAIEKCPFTSEKCWWKHTNKAELSDHTINHTADKIIKCSLCQTQFENKGSMMLHRKKEHKTAVKNCNQFQENNCRYGKEGEGCWFVHLQNDDKKKENVGEKHEPAESVFQKVQENLKPPIRSTGKSME